MPYNMLRRTKSSSLLPILRLTNYFYPDGKQSIDETIMTTPSPQSSSPIFNPYSPPSRNSSVSSRHSSSSASSNGRSHAASSVSTNVGSRELSLPPDYEQLYSAMQLDVAFDTTVEEERVRRKYACQGLKLVASALAEDSGALSRKELSLSKDLYLNGVEYILRGLPSKCSSPPPRPKHSYLSVPAFLLFVADGRFPDAHRKSPNP